MVSRWVLFFWVLVFSLVANAEEKYQFENPQQRADFLLLTKELRCPKCQNQNIADSNALIANDMKRKVHQLLLEGNDKQQVIEFMKVRYGEFVHYQPPMTPVTFWLYFGPVLFVLTCFGYFIYQRRRNDGQNVAQNITGSVDDQQIEKLKRAESALKDTQ